MKSFLFSLMAGIFVSNLHAQEAEASKAEIKLESRSEAMTRLDKGLIVERLRKAYQPVSIKLEGAWTVQSAATTETWNFAGGQWKCEGSTMKCSDWLPQSFKFFSAKGWLSAGGPKERTGYDFAGAQRVVAERHSTNQTPEGEEPPGEEKLHFEGKRNALEVWEWESSALGSLNVMVSLRDYLIERIKTSDSEETLEWAQRPGAKGLSLEKVFIERGNEKLLFTRK